MKKILLITCLLCLTGCPARVDPSATQQHQLCDAELHTQDSIQSYVDVLNYLHQPVPNILAAVEAAKKGKEHAEKAAASQADAAKTGLQVSGEFEKVQKRNQELENALLSPRMKRGLFWFLAALAGVIAAFWFSPTPVKIVTWLWGLLRRR